MKRTTLKVLVVAGAAVAFAACSESTTPSLVSDAQIDADAAANSGDAVATGLDIMLGDDSTAGSPMPGSIPGSPSSFTFTRQRTCYDSANTVLPGCTPIASVRKITTHVTADGSRSGTNFTGVAHLIRDMTVVRTFNGASEVSRTHDGVGTANDTTNFNNGTVARTHAETATDSVQSVKWNVPRSSNPFPVSGKFIRNATIHVTFSSASRTETKDVTRRVEVDFPADAQGNVVLKINAKTCNLNLVTHVVSNCQ